MTTKPRTLALTLLATALLVGCSSTPTTDSKIEAGPVGIGRSINELKGSPCACTEIPMEIPTYMMG